MVFHIDDATVTRPFKTPRPLVAQHMTASIVPLSLDKEEGWKLIVDATEQETERRDGSGYVGKKKKHTIKTQVIVIENGHMRHISSSVPGHIHDKRLYDLTGELAHMG
jgi:hypothetical protein